MVKTPVCRDCALAGRLCPGCSKKLSQGKISSLYVQVTKALYEINETHNLGEASLVKAVDLEKVLLLFTDGEVGVLIGKEGKVVSELSKRLGKKVRVASYGKDLKKTIADIIMPVQLIGINHVYGVDKEKIKLRLPKKQIAELPLSPEGLQKIVGQLFGVPAEIAFE